MRRRFLFAAQAILDGTDSDYTEIISQQLGKQMSADEIRVAIIKGNFTIAELEQITMAVRFANSELSRHVKRSVVLGGTVSWVSTKNPLGIQGVVTSMGRKNLKVRVGNTVWTVPASMCKVV
jgi:hypothetical protein